MSCRAVRRGGSRSRLNKNGWGEQRDEEKMGRICRSTKKYDQRESLGRSRWAVEGWLGCGTWTWPWYVYLVTKESTSSSWERET